MFDFNKLIDAYRNDNILWAREYLYNNIMVLVTKELMSWIDQNIHVDIVHDLYLKVDEWIQDSIEKDYKSKQIYSYIKLRVSWFIINYYKFEIWKNYINTNYMCEDNRIDNDEQDPKETIDMNPLHKFPSLMLDAIDTCTEDEKKLARFVYIGLDLTRIKNILNRDIKKTKSINSSAMKKIKKHLHNKGITYEDLCKR